jgi:hypothetical protein
MTVGGTAANGSERPRAHENVAGLVCDLVTARGAEFAAFANILIFPTKINVYGRMFSALSTAAETLDAYDEPKRATCISNG